MKRFVFLLVLSLTIALTSCSVSTVADKSPIEPASSSVSALSSLPESSVISSTDISSVLSSAEQSSKSVSSAGSSHAASSAVSKPVKSPVVTVKDIAMDPAFASQTGLINEFTSVLNGYHDNIAVYYEDLETSRTIEYNTNRVFHPASVIKVPYMMYIYELAEQGKASLGRIFTYTEKNFREGSGKISGMPIGSTFSTEQLIEYSIRFSDNIAFYMLRDVYSPASFQNYAKSLKVSSGSNPMNRITAKDCAIYYHRVYDKAKQGNASANRLLSYMKRTKYNQQIQKGVPGIPIAHKYGWWNGNFHDAAIVYDKHPYMLIIFTNCDPEAEPSFQIFKSVTEVIQKIHGTQAR